MRTNRLETFSDGVLAIIIITIMVLELKMPEGHHLRDLVHTTGVGLLTYLLSFVCVGLYWNNHHHMFHLAPRRSAPVKSAPRRSPDPATTAIVSPPPAARARRISHAVASDSG